MMAAPFQASQWLDELTAIGGGYAQLPEGKVCFMVGNCTGDALQRQMEQITGHPDRLEQVKRTIAHRHRGEA